MEEKATGLFQEIQAAMASLRGVNGVVGVSLLAAMEMCAGGAVTMVEISRRLGHSTAATTGLVDRAEKLGVLVRERNSGDRRKVYVSLTVEGRRKLEELWGAAGVKPEANSKP